MFVRSISKKVGDKYAWLVENIRQQGRIKQRLVLKVGSTESISKARVDAVFAALRPLSSSPGEPFCITGLVVSIFQGFLSCRPMCTSSPKSRSSDLLEKVLQISLKDVGQEISARRALEELESIRMVESDVQVGLVTGW